MQFSKVSAFVIAAQLSAIAHAQDALPAVTEAATEAPAAAEEHYEEDIVVVAGRPRGSVEGNIQADKTLGPQEIRSYGASSLEDLLEQLAPLTGSARGRGGGMPVVLVNGKRVTGFREIRNIPPEAIQRVDILPEEAALSYGYPADQRVVNFVLRQRFKAVTGELEVGAPTAGGSRDVELEANLLRISGDTRLQFDLGFEHSSRLLESSRNITRTPSGLPRSVAGNIANGGNEIDPALSGLAGEVVTIAPVPGSAANGAPVLGDFVGGANNPSITNEAAYRTLRPQVRTLTAGGSYTRPLGDRTQLTLSASLEQETSQSRLGLPGATLTIPTGNPYSPFANDVSLLSLTDVAGPLVRQADSWSGLLAAAINGPLASWRYSATASHAHSESDVATDRRLDMSAAQASLDALDPAFNPFAPGVLNGPRQTDKSTSNTDLSSVDLVLNGRLFDMPAGSVAMTVKAGLDHTDLESGTNIGGLNEITRLDRTQGRGQASIDLPIASRKNEVLSFLGDLSLNANIAGESYSDFGQLLTWGGGATWRPVPELQVIASYTFEEGAPTIGQLGEPLTLTPNVFVFDYTRGETVEITRLDGGNADLSADRRRVFKLGARFQPLEKLDLRLRADYVATSITGPIASFPTVTAEIEAAFPERFVRDADGRLLSLDNRPVNFARSSQRELRWGFDYSRTIKPTAAEQAVIDKRRAEFQARQKAVEEAGTSAAGGPGTTPPPVAGGPGGFGGGGPRGPGGGRGAGGGRFMFSMFHTWALEDSILIREGVPELDLLNGSAIGSSGGVSRHLIETQIGANKNGYGARLSLDWQSATNVRVAPNGVPSPEDLRFSSMTTVNLRLFADLSQRQSLVQKYPWFRGSRISIGVDNLFDKKMDVRNRAGERPENYQPDLIDPQGRTVEISFRKMFF